MPSHLLIRNEQHNGIVFYISPDLRNLGSFLSIRFKATKNIKELRERINKFFDGGVTNATTTKTK